MLSEQAQEALASAKSAVESDGAPPWVEYHLLSGDVVESVLLCAAEVRADMLVAGYHGRNRLATLVMGSVVGRLVRSTELPVLIVRR